MTPGTLEKVHASLHGRGWAVAPAKALGLPAEEQVIAALAPYLVPDPRGEGKQHARDVFGYEAARVREEDSIAHIDGADDYSRFELLSDTRTAKVAGTFLAMIPAQLRSESGRVSADYFRYSPGTEAGPHQDGFGDIVAIWVLGRHEAAGAESFLIDMQGRDVLRGAVPAGQVLIFQDAHFLHGVTPLKAGTRDALTFIRLKDGG